VKEDNVSLVSATNRAVEIVEFKGELNDLLNRVALQHWGGSLVAALRGAIIEGLTMRAVLGDPPIEMGNIGEGEPRIWHLSCFLRAGPIEP